MGAGEMVRGVGDFYYFREINIWGLRIMVSDSSFAGLYSADYCQPATIQFESLRWVDVRVGLCLLPYL